MSKNYKYLAENIKNRVNPENIALSKSFSEELSNIAYSDVLIFIRTAMKGVDPGYTQKSKEAGERVKEHLSLGGLNDTTYRYQGSVMTNTHIKAHSDIDLLVLSDKFYQADNVGIRQLLENAERRANFFSSSIVKMENELKASSYLGNVLDDLRKNRFDSENILTSKYSICDTTKPKSIKITNLSLKRDVDIVIANWYDDITSVINDKGDYRGIQVYNKSTNSRETPDFPFLSIARINERGAVTQGRVKKMIRFIKNIKALSDQHIDISSFDINAICYDIDIKKYQNLPFYELVPVIYFQIKNLCENQTLADNLVSVDGREYIFRSQSSKLNNLKLLLKETEQIFLDLHRNILSK